MKAIFKKELRSFFLSMTGYALIAFLITFVGIYFMIYNIGYGYPYFAYTLSGVMLILLVLVPVITMRSFAEEKKNRTDQLLFTSPIKIRDIVLGKYAAMVSVFFVPNVVFCLFPLIIKTMGNSSLLSDYVSLMEFFLMGCAFIAIGMFFSSVTESPMIAAVITFAVTLILYIWDTLIGYLPSSAFANLAVLIVIVICGAFIMVQDAYSYYYGSGSITEFDGDGQLTSAINKVTGQETKKVYLASGHGETELSATMTSLMTKSAVETEELDLFMTEEIPEDCDMLIFNGPTTDIREGEKSVVDSYIKNGGSVIMLMSEDTPSSGNLADLLSSYEITPEDGYVADMERNYLGNYYAIFPEVTDSSGITGDLSTGTVMVNNSRAFTLGESGDEIEVSSMMETSDYGYLVTDEGQEEGSFVLAAAVTYTAAQEDSDSSDSTESADDTSSDGDSSSDGEVTTGNLIVFGSQSLIDESITEAFSNLDNTTMFMNVMTSALGDVQNLSIEAKSLEVQYNTVQNGGAISVFLIFIIPAAFLVAGFVFWYRRRKV